MNGDFENYINEEVKQINDEDWKLYKQLEIEVIEEIAFSCVADEDYWERFHKDNLSLQQMIQERFGIEQTLKKPGGFENEQKP